MFDNFNNMATLTYLFKVENILIFVKLCTYNSFFSGVQFGFNF